MDMKKLTILRSKIAFIYTCVHIVVKAMQNVPSVCLLEHVQLNTVVPDLKV